MTYYLGPILNLYKSEKGFVEISILNVTDLNSEIDITSESDDIRKREVDLRSKRLHQHIIRVELDNTKEKIVTYQRTGDSEMYSFVVPSVGESPRLAFCSCNGFSSGREAKKVEYKNNLWKSVSGARHKGLLDVHEANSFHILLMGGDQVYADSIWEEVEVLKQYQDLDFTEKVNFSVNSDLETQIDDFYFNLYLTRWSSKELTTAFSSIPTIMMWDDHDIFDGFGSYHEDLQNSDLYKTIFKYANKYFRLFQMHLFDDVDNGSCFSGLDYSNYKVIGKLGILSVDLRKNRSIERVVHEESWKKIFENDYSTVEHLFVCSSIPVVHPDMSWIDDIAGFLLPHQYEDKFELMDDLRDHWNSREHKKERIRLLYNLFNISKNKTRVSILSGDVHVAAMGIIENERDFNGNSSVINQFTSSGIVHPGPPTFMTYFYEILSKKHQELDRGIKASMINFPGTSQKFTNKRNWMSFIPAKEKYWANLYVENERGCHEKAIHKIDK